MEIQNKINKIYVDLLINLLDDLRERKNIAEAVQILETYEILVDTPGYCLIFCMTEDRIGAESELKNLLNIFEHQLKYKMKVVINPTYDQVETDLCLTSP